MTWSGQPCDRVGCRVWAQQQLWWCALQGVPRSARRPGMCARVVALAVLAPGRGGIDRPVRRPLRHGLLCGRRWRAVRRLVCWGQECNAVGAPRGARKHWVHCVLPLRAQPPIEGRRRRGPWGAGGIYLLRLLLSMLQQLMRGAGRAVLPANHAPFPPREVADALKATSQPQRARSSSTAPARPPCAPSARQPTVTASVHIAQQSQAAGGAASRPWSSRQPHTGCRGTRARPRTTTTTAATCSSPMNSGERRGGRAGRRPTAAALA